MPVLLRDPQQILSQHELPGHGGMPRMVGPAPSNIECLDTLAPTPAGDFRVVDRPSVFEKEEVLMADFAGRDVLSAGPSAASELRGRAGKAQRRDLPGSWCGLYPAAGHVPW